ncbi:hypothetical protein CAOG_02315 [Capsaspora owczarzaki ATCC 30864]|uniref:Autophagy-related protein 27 n=1 Tax=Capsaspora owczarzaki (strain ATCC 30864) TaxID=595528 RepID=A0A0D2X1N8_CAPO3|nr:hypothetical protein CAOG_02315 [Capsaspora owczarzaki ATCC 30864]KJE91134.1 hypothetical protein CAOG_002315 [Capsaspora owczarzaki ATCC 30864]KJE91135.1 hypothetical protein, variant [Capsaspora owczarzaki ATCC 30864]|eukprot:XP_004349065.2 hypothetical protein CAOG_02315 [Capsaspora owczarzaki ATCC 30864]
MMMMARLAPTLLVVLAAIVTLAAADSFDLQQCKYTTSTNEIIDIAGLRQSTPLRVGPFQDGSITYYVYYNFCPNLGSSPIPACKKDAIMCLSTGAAIATTLTNVAGLNVDFSGDTATSSRLHLNCDKSITGAPSMTLTKSSLTWVVTLSHQCACPGVCPVASEGGGISGGSILLAIFFPSVFVYLVVGVLIKRRGGATGTDAIPNIAFWREVPGLIKDGFKFVFSCGNSGYTKV